jgi:hypothetical protein
MAWANGEPAPAPPANGNGQSSNDQNLCFELFRILGISDVEQAKLVQQYSVQGGTDWAKLNLELEKQLPKE